MKTCLFCQYAEVEEYPFKTIFCMNVSSENGLDKRSEDCICDKFEYDYKFRRILEKEGTNGEV